MAPSDLETLRERKHELRRAMLARRAAIEPAIRAEAARAAAWQALTVLPWRERREVALSWPMGEEIDTRPLLHALAWLGATPLLPRMAGKGRPLAFHAWTPEMALVPGPFGVLEPPPGLPVALPGIVLAPLLAFDRYGGRLGYGAGFYDRTFTTLAEAGCRPLRAGYCLAAQEVPEVPVDDTDIPLELVITEAGAQRVEGRG